MGLTAAQIRTKLKPMMDFAPAILAAAEIVEAAEAAEPQLTALATSVTMAQEALVGLEQQKADRVAEILALQADVERVKRETTEEKNAALKKLKEVTDKLDLAQKALLAAQDEHAKVMAQHSEEVDSKRNELDLQKRQLQALRDAIPV